MRMKIAEAKAKLSQLVAAAEAGDDVVIMRGNKPVARLTGLSVDGRDTAVADSAVPPAAGERPWMQFVGSLGHLRHDMPDLTEPGVTDAEVQTWLDDPNE
ncbi:type II toxin-antitoxin system prevent-host-death family antitoxin [Jannaschia sp. LMIT008]|uniref:type II toxin-antitoxin system Phd/YefM family antitoxin n=1 Tax=Jannaschia maritima TaxID=3032585 RepID=UPI002811B2FD|nr:type II toxin-antitoxin system prevent-host-death family antitoxin [Jannaschia sp. LMIT008]